MENNYNLECGEGVKCKGHPLQKMSISGCDPVTPSIPGELWNRDDWSNTEISVDHVGRVSLNRVTDGDGVYSPTGNPETGRANNSSNPHAMPCHYKSNSIFGETFLLHMYIYIRLFSFRSFDTCFN